MKEKLLITGSSGYLGREIISDSRIKKFEIITLDKNKVSNPDIHVDLNSQKLEDILSRTLDLEVNYSILNLAAARTDYASNETYFLENIKATENFLSVLDSMKVYVKKFIHLSSVAIFEGLQLMEEEVCFDELSSDNCYQYSKATQERIITKWAEKNNIELTIIRPSAIFSKNQPSNTNIGKLIFFTKYSPIIFMSPVKKSLTYIKNLTDNIFESLTSNNHGIMLAIEKPVTSLYEIQKMILERKKFPSFKIFLNKKILLKISTIYSKVFSLFFSDPVFTPNRVEKFFKDTAEFKEGNLEYKQNVSLERAFKDSL
tara:strand:+ start:226 stop:1170 length:945 start_codon:yes stop_codon:yes gene_type:complete